MMFFEGERKHYGEGQDHAELVSEAVTGFYYADVEGVEDAEEKAQGDGEVEGKGREALTDVLPGESCGEEDAEDPEDALSLGVLLTFHREYFEFGESCGHLI